MDNTSFDDINTLDSYSFIAGSYQVLIFTILDANNVPIDISGATCSWKICPLGQSDVVTLTKSATITDAPGGVFQVVLEPADTNGLSGVYVQQPRAVAFDGTVYLPAQGNLTIIPEIE